MAIVGMTLAVVSTAAAPVAAKRAPPVSVDLGAWDCDGSPMVTRTLTTGTHRFTWKGDCAGAEGWSAVVEPKSRDLVVRQGTDASGTVWVEITNRSSKPRAVRLRVYVGFA